MVFMSADTFLDGESELNGVSETATPGSRREFCVGKVGGGKFPPVAGLEISIQNKREV